MITNKEASTPIHFTSKLFKIGSWIILRVPETASAKLPSHALTMVEGTINEIPFKIALEPDGRGGHWFKVSPAILKATKTAAGDTVKLTIKPTNEWLEPEVPEDVKKAFAAIPQVQALWTDITPNARWDWIRWIQSTKQPETRKRRIEVSCSKLKSGMRRPCCFNRNMCTDPYVSHNGILLEQS